MNDDSPKPTSLPRFPTDAELDAEVDAAREAMLAAIVVFAEKYGRRQWSTGWDAGWLKGRETLMEAFKTGVPDKPKPAPVQPGITAQYALPKRTAQDDVFEFIGKNAGLRGVEIASAFSNSPGLPERTVRTALHRLKKAKKIEIVEGRWYTTEAAAAVPRQRQLLGDDDAAP